MDILLSVFALSLTSAFDCYCVVTRSSAWACS